MTDTHDWLWDTAWGRFIRKCIHTFLPILAFFATFWAIQQTEQRFFPVVTQWDLSYIERQGDYFVMGGRLYKDRRCELVNTVVVGVPRNPLLPRVTIYQIDPNEMLGADVPVGNHTWGPWEVRIPKTLLQYKDMLGSIEVVGRHRCHALWLQETVYGDVPIERVPL